MRENPPSEPQFNKLIRTIAANEPRVTKFKINWESSASAAAAAAAAAIAGTTSAEADGIESTMEVNQTTSLFHSSNSNQLQSQPSTAVTLPMDNNCDKIENKENILMQQKGFNTNEQNKMTEAPVAQNHLVENSYDSIMN